MQIMLIFSRYLYTFFLLLLYKYWQEAFDPDDYHNKL